jgi:hypothetical protein
LASKEKKKNSTAKFGALQDNIVIASKNKEDHLADLAEIFANMRDARLRLNPEKCVFEVRQGKILGYLVSHRGIKANPTKI